MTDEQDTSTTTQTETEKKDDGGLFGSFRRLGSAAINAGTDWFSGALEETGKRFSALSEDVKGWGEKADAYWDRAQSFGNERFKASVAAVKDNIDTLRKEASDLQETIATKKEEYEQVLRDRGEEAAAKIKFEMDCLTDHLERKKKDIADGTETMKGMVETEEKKSS